MALLVQTGQLMESGKLFFKIILLRSKPVIYLHNIMIFRESGISWLLYARYICVVKHRPCYSHCR